ncbi:MAG: hypothetical protein ABSB60_08135 [Terracidiphilus sp.]
MQLARYYAYQGEYGTAAAFGGAATASGGEAAGRLSRVCIRFIEMCDVQAITVAVLLR